MDRETLKHELLDNIRRLNRTAAFSCLREMTEGEVAALRLIRRAGGGTTPSQISGSLGVSRARVANILSCLRKKGYVEMDISATDRRRMDVVLTEAGGRALDEKIARSMQACDEFIDALGEEDAAELNRILQKTAGMEQDAPAPHKGGDRT